MSVAAWRGLFQLFRRPYYWEKTDHGLAQPEQLPADSLAVSPALSASATAADPYAQVFRASTRIADSRRSWRRALTARWRALLSESLALFAAAYAVYAGVGLYTTLHLHLVEED